MAILDAALALALTFVVFGTVVTTITEILQRALRLRARKLQNLLEYFVEQEVLPKLDAGTASGGGAAGKPATAPELAAQLVNALFENAMVRAQQDKYPLRRMGMVFQALTEKTSLDTPELLRRLARTAPVQAWLRREGAAARGALASLAAAYDDYSEQARDYFKRRAQLTALVIGVVLALVANVDALRIFDVFLHDQALAERVIASSDTILQASRQAQESLQAVQGSQAGNAGKELDEMAALRNQARESLQDISKLGVPIGWSEMPFKDPVGFARWLLRALITGLLIGLGAPFWFDVASRLAQVRSAVKGGAPPAGELQALAGPAASPVDSAVSSIVGALPASSSGAVRRRLLV